MEKICRSLKQLKIELSFDSTILFMGIYLKECAAKYSRATSMPGFIAALLNS
jgi:hypothetical protein